MRRLLAVCVIATAALATATAWAAEQDPPPLGVTRPLAPATNPTTEARVALGKRLFGDTRLSVDGTTACATCHLASLAFTDGLPLAEGLNGKTLARNSPTLLNVGLVRELFHDGRAPSLEEQAREVVLNQDELGWDDETAFAEHVGAIDEYPPLFEAAFGDPQITLQRVTRALAAFERTLLSGDSPFDRWWNGETDAMTEEQVRGYRVFINEGACGQCHSIRQSYATFSDGRFHNTGAGKGAGKEDVGRITVSGNAEDHGAFRTPTLRNVELTSPYMHDGSLATLEEVIDFYVDGGAENPHLSPLMRPLDLDDEDRSDLLAFLRALTSPVIPQLEDCDKLLADGRPHEAWNLFHEAYEANADDARALVGMARSALVLDDAGPLGVAERELRSRINTRSPNRTNDADAVVARHLLFLGRVSAALSNHEEALAVARAEDALLAWSRIRKASEAPLETRDAALLLETEWLEFMGRRDAAVELYEARLAADAPTDDFRTAAAAAIYRRGWRAFSFGGDTESGKLDVQRAAELYDDLLARDVALSGEHLLFRAYARHYAGETDAAIAAYRDAATVEDSAESALGGLRNLLARDIETYRSMLEALAVERPNSPAVLYFVGFERLAEGRLDEAEEALRERLRVETSASPGPHVYLARIHAQRSEHDDATNHYAIALALDPAFRGLVSEFEQHIRSRELTGWDAVDALVTDYEIFLEANPDDPRFQVLARNNLAFLLRDVAASFASRGPARVHTFPEGAPDEAYRAAEKCLALYEEAVARIPADVADLPFSERWVYAGVLNDTGLVLHYFSPLQDLERAEEYYLRAFDLTGGAYMDAYFYNLQFLYGFELDDREERWFELADIARRRILREDPESDTGFSPDHVKRRAAQRDYERLAATLGR